MKSVPLIVFDLFVDILKFFFEDFGVALIEVSGDD